MDFCLQEREEEPDSEISRFQRQERFKHNALNDCNKKVALTIKIASEPNFRLFEDDYKSQVRHQRAFSEGTLRYFVVPVGTTRRLSKF